jgi:TonB family protein
MKIKYSAIILLLLSFTLYAQQDKENRKVELADGSFVVPDKYPELLKPIKPVYPPEAISQNIQGKVFVKVTIDTKGRVLKAEIANGINQSLNKAALEAVGRMEFTPAIVKGRSTKISTAIPISFILAAENYPTDTKVELDIKENEPDPRVFELVEKEPAPVKLTKPVYPQSAIKKKITGLVILRVLVSKTGKPIKTLIIKADNKIFIEPAKEAAMKTTFTPAIKNGQPVLCWINIPFKFTIGQN